MIESAPPKALEVASTILAATGVMFAFVSVGMVATGLFSSFHVFLIGCVVLALGIAGIACSRRIVSHGLWAWRVSVIWCVAVLCFSCWMVVESMSDMDETSLIASFFAAVIFISTTTCFYALLKTSSKQWVYGDDDESGEEPTAPTPAPPR